MPLDLPPPLPPKPDKWQPPPVAPNPANVQSQRLKNEAKPLPAPNISPIDNKSPSIVGRVSDPRKSIILKSNILGKVWRGVLRVLRLNSRIDGARTEANALNLEDQAQLKSHIKENVERLQEAPKVSDYRLLEGNTAIAKLPQKRSLAKWKEAFEKKPIMNKSLAAATHVDELINNLTNNKPADELESLDGKGWTGLRIDSSQGQMAIHPGYVSSTSERSTGTHNHSDLYNIYVHISDKGRISVTSAVIDTPQRAEEFMQAVIYAIKQWQADHLDQPLPPPRIAMHQLNTHGIVGPWKTGAGEAKLIEGQNRMQTYMNVRLPQALKDADIEPPPDGPYIIHKNHAINTMSNLPQESSLAARNNLKGTAGQMVWISEEIGNKVNDAEYSALCQEIKNIQNTLTQLEFQALPPDEKLQGKDAESYQLLHTLRDQRNDLTVEIDEELNQELPFMDVVEAKKTELTQINQHIAELEEPIQKTADKALMKAVKSEIKAERKKLNQQLAQLLIVQDRLANSDNVDNTRKEILKLGNIILADQLKYYSEDLINVKRIPLDILSGLLDPLKTKTLTQNQRLAFDLLLDQRLGITSQANCKSSCDRTAVARALIECLPRIKSFSNPGQPANPAEQREFIMNFEENVLKMDAAFKGSGYETMNKFLNSEAIDNSHFKPVYQFQVDMFTQWMATSMPMTGRSTGLEGFKWSHDTQSPFKNAHPLPFVPAEVYDEESGEFVKLIDFEEKSVLRKWGTGDWQSNRKLTEEGNWVLMGNAQGRGT